MKIVNEIELRGFDFWGGAEDNASQLTYEELDEIENMLTNYQEEWGETELNDFFRFDFDTICEMLCLELDDNGNIIREDDEADDN